MLDFTPNDDEPHAGRFYGVAREWLRGKPEVASRYFGLARVLLGNLRHEMALEEVPVAARSVTLPDGTTVRVACACGINQIFIDSEGAIAEPSPDKCEFLVESGVVHYVVAGTERIVEDTAPGTLYRGEKDQVPLAKNDRSPVTITGDDGSTIDLLPMGEHEGRSLSYDVPLLGVADADLDKVVAEKEALFIKIDTVSRFPSSLYSGKMQLFLQALYGTPVPLFRLGYQKVEFGIDFLVLDDVEIHFESSHTTGILTRTIEVGPARGRIDYFMVSLEASDNETSVSIRKIALTQCGQRLLDFVLYLARTEYKNRLDSKEWKGLFTRFEAYWFSTARVKTEVVASAALPRLLGVPFSQHGWAFSWDGKQAHLVTHEAVSLGGDNSKRIARLYSVTITADLAPDGADQFSLTLAVDESVEYQIRPGTDLIWYYDYRISKMVTVVTTGNPTPFGNGAPICCYRDLDDVLRVVRYSYHSETIAAPAPGYEMEPDLYCYSINNQTSASETVDLYWGTVVTAGFYCNEVFDTRRRTGEHEYHRSHSLVVTPSPMPEAPIYDGSNYLGMSTSAIPMQSFGVIAPFSTLPPQPGQWSLRAASFIDTLHREQADATVSETLLIVPKNDVRAVYTGTYTIKPNAVVFDRVLGGYRGWEQYFYIRPNPEVIGVYGAGFGGYGGYIYTGNGGEISSGGSTGTRYLVDVELSDRQPKRYSIVERESTDYYIGVGSWASFFDPPMTTDPTNDIIFFVIHSLDSDLLYFTNDPDPDLIVADDGEYPLGSTFNFIGWT